MSITKFKEYIRMSFGPSCKYNVCRINKDFIHSLIHSFKKQ